MPSRTQETIYETFVAVSGGHSISRHFLIDASERIAKPGARTGAQIRTAKPVTWRADELATPSRTAGATNTKAPSTTAGSTTRSVASTVLQSVFQSVPLVGAVAGPTSSAGSIGNRIESLASTVLKSGLGIVPLIGGLLGLFGGGGSPAPPALTKYVMPSSIAFEGADTRSGIGTSDYNQMGQPRTSKGGAPEALQAGSTGPAAGSGEGGTGPTPASASSGSNAATPHNSVEAQATDARWFMDHSAAIAAAVRYAMLNSNSINDVVNEL